MHLVHISSCETVFHSARCPSGMMVRVSDQYSEGLGFRSQLDPKFFPFFTLSTKISVRSKLLSGQLRCSNQLHTVMHIDSHVVHSAVDSLASLQVDPQQQLAACMQCCRLVDCSIACRLWICWVRCMYMYKPNIFHMIHTIYTTSEVKRVEYSMYLECTAVCFHSKCHHSDRLLFPHSLPSEQSLNYRCRQPQTLQWFHYSRPHHQRLMSHSQLLCLYIVQGLLSNFDR